MKLNSTIAAIVLGLGTASVASATNYIYITGSTAARGAVYNSLAAGVGFDGGVAPSVIIAYGNANPANGSYQEFVGTIGGVQTIVKTAWSGSEAGVADVSGSGTENFLADPGTAGVPATTTTVSTSPTSGNLVASTVNLSLADNALTYSRNPGSTAVQQGPIVVVPFVIVKNHTPGNDAANGSAAWTNITSDQFKAVAKVGTDIGLFLGTAQKGYNVYLAGRDNLSGTRVNVFGETGFGITSTPQQIELNPGSGNPATTTLLLPAGNTPGTYYTALGQSSGGTLAKSLGDTSSAADLIADPSGNTPGFYVIAYLGLADDATATGSPYNAINLSYNGVPYSAAAVENGTYALWGNEYILSKAGSASNVTGLQSALAANLQNHTDAYEIPLTSMLVKRSGPTSSPTY